MATNKALASEGGVATASSVHSAGFPIASVNDGTRNSGGAWGAGGGWNSAGNPGVGSEEWVVITFDDTYLIDEIDVFTLPDSINGPDPTLSDTFSAYGIVDYKVQVWNGSGWDDVDVVTGNNHVWTQHTFTPVSTDKVRIFISAALASFARVLEVEAWTSDVVVNATTTGVNTMTGLSTITF